MIKLPEKFGPAGLAFMMVLGLSHGHLHAQTSENVSYTATCASVEGGTRFERFHFSFVRQGKEWHAEMIPLAGARRPVPEFKDLEVSFIRFPNGMPTIGVLDKRGFGEAGALTISAPPQQWTGRPNNFNLQLIARSDWTGSDQAMIWHEKFRCEFPASGTEEQPK